MRFVIMHPLINHSYNKKVDTPVSIIHLHGSLPLQPHRASLHHKSKEKIK
jgi:hypothetical protein